MRSIAMLAVVSAALTAPASALASKVSVEDGTAVFRSGAYASDATLDTRPTGDPAFTDALQTLTAGPGCVAGNPVVCPDGWAAQAFKLGSGNDRVRAWTSGALSVTAGSGGDDIEANGGSTVVDAGSGADRVIAGSNGTAQVTAGDGNDDVRSDTGLNAKLDGNGGNDLVVAITPFRNDLTGGSGNDDLFAIPADPSGFGGGGFGSISAGSGDDAIIVHSIFEFVGYEIDAGDGHDVIYGGGGEDDVTAGSGNDRIDVSGDHAVMGAVDTVNCGWGFDKVYADPEDTVAANCEQVLSGPMPRPAVADRALAHLADAFPELTAPPVG